MEKHDRLVAYRRWTPHPQQKHDQAVAYRRRMSHLARERHAVAKALAGARVTEAELELDGAYQLWRCWRCWLAAKRGDRGTVQAEQPADLRRCQPVRGDLDHRSPTCDGWCRFRAQVRQREGSGRSIGRRLERGPLVGSSRSRPRQPSRSWRLTRGRARRTAAQVWRPSRRRPSRSGRLDPSASVWRRSRTTARRRADRAIGRSRRGSERVGSADLLRSAPCHSPQRARSAL